MKLYQLAVKGDYAAFSGSGTARSKNVWATEAQAEAEKERLTEQTCDQRLLKGFDIDSLKFFVIELNFEGEIK